MIEQRGGPRVPWIQKKHVDGPMLVRSDGGLHWLTWRERIALFFGRTDAQKLDQDLVLKAHLRRSKT